MNTFDEIRLLCKYLFGFEPSTMQMRFWYFGGRNASEKRKQHKEFVEKTVAQWDVVVRLAMHYTKKAIAKQNRRWADNEVMRFIYHCIWSPYKMIETNKKDGKAKDMPTFWMWAVEHRHTIRPAMSDTAAVTLKDVFRRAAENIK